MGKKTVKCSHKAIEWKQYMWKKERGYIGLFPPTEHCYDCEESKLLKGSPPTQSNRGLLR